MARDVFVTVDGVNVFLVLFVAGCRIDNVAFPRVPVDSTVSAQLQVRELRRQRTQGARIEHVGCLEERQGHQAWRGTEVSRGSTATFHSARSAVSERLD